MEEAGHSGGCPGAKTHTVCRTGGEIGGNGGHGYPHHKETAFPALTYTYATVLSTVCIYVHRHSSLPVDSWRERVSPPVTISPSSASHNSTHH